MCVCVSGKPQLRSCYERLRSRALRFGSRIPWDWLAFQGPPLTELGSEAVGSHAKLGVLSKIVEELDCWSLENRVSGIVVNFGGTELPCSPSYT